MLQDLDFQHAIQPVHLVRYFWQNKPSEEKVIPLSEQSLYWDISGRLLQTSLEFEASKQLAEGFLRTQSVTNIILDFRAIDAITPALVNQLWEIIRQVPASNPYRVIYALVDKSTGLLITDLLSRLEQMPEVVFVGQPLGINLSHYYDPKEISLNKTGLTLTIATRYEKYLTSEATGSFRPDHVVDWRADDFFAGSDTVLNTVLDLIEINQPD
jgi:hypothetical protein